MDPSTEELQRDLESFIRVRNRLAVTKDEKLPSILTKLLPKLFGRMEQLDNLSQSSTLSAEGEDIRIQMISHLKGTICHAIDRIEGVRNMDAPWVNTVLPLLKTLESEECVSLLLVLLQLGIQRSEDQVHFIPVLVQSLDRFSYTSAIASMEERNNMVNHSSACTWLLINAVASTAGVQNTNDWEILPSCEKKLKQMDGADIGTYEAVKISLQNGGNGLMDLMLDITFLWPTRQYQIPGMSEYGMEKMKVRSRTTSFDENYLRQLKRAFLRFAIDAFQQNVKASDRCHLLSILVLRGKSSYQKLAASHLRKNFDKKMLKSEGKWRNDSAGCSLGLVFSLLILIIGDERASNLLADPDYHSVQGIWEDILGPRPSDHYFFRSPLSPQRASKAIEFILHHFKPDMAEWWGSHDFSQINFLVHLIVLVPDENLYGRFRLLALVYQKLRKAGNEEFLKKPFLDHFMSSAQSIISNVSANDDDNGVVQDGHHVPDRHSTNASLIDRHRAQLKARYLASERAVNVRNVAYEMIADILHEYWKQSDIIDDGFRLPKIMFCCVIAENIRTQSHVAKVLNALLTLYQRSFTNSTDNYLERQCLVAPLLPSLICAASSDSLQSKVATVKWCEEFISAMDPDAASFFCRHLSCDPDPRVSEEAKLALHHLSGLAYTRTKPLHTIELSTITLIDTLKEVNRDFIFDDLNSRIDILFKEFSVSRSFARFILQDQKFNIEDARKMLSQRDAVCQDNVGFTEWAQNAHEANEQLSTCTICYDDFPLSKGFALSCGHIFCNSCWRSYLFSKAQDMPQTFHEVSCPHQRCRERLSLEEISHLEESLFDKWKSSLLRCFIEQDRMYSSCPGPDCTIVAYCVSPISNTTVSCNCKARYCFQCGAIPHNPASCKDFEAWRQTVGTSSELWISTNSKPCPSCNVPIEKNLGCNHMNCTHCNCHFCWICMDIMDMRSAHICNEIGSTINDKNKLDHFFGKRFIIHKEEEIFARGKIEDFTARREEYMGEYHFMDEEHLDIIYEAAKTLVDARSFLQYSYVYAWALQKRNLPGYLKFEHHLAILELVTERLGRMVHQTSYVNIFNEGGSRGFNIFCRGLQFHVLSITLYMQRIQFLETSFCQEADGQQLNN